MSHAANRYVKHLVQAPNGDSVSIAEKLILSLLADDHNEDERAAWPSVPKLAMRACMSEVHCRRLLKKLEKSGVLESMPTLRDNGGRSTSWYRFPQIDPPFDKKRLAHTQKLIELQARRTAARPVQMKLAGDVQKPVDKPMERAHPPSLPGEGPPLTEDRGPLSSSTGAPSHPGEAPPLTEDRGPLSSRRGGKEPLFKPPLEPLGQPPLESSVEPKTPPTPSKLGVKSSPVESAGQTAASEALESDWNLLKARLKQGLRNVPMGVSKRFTEIRKGEDDYDAAFRDWWILGRRDEKDRIVLVTHAADPAATEKGLEKYKARLLETARGALRDVRGRKVVFVVQPAPARVYLAASAEEPEDPGT